MLKTALVGAGIVFAANMVANTAFVVAKKQASPGSLVWDHANVLVGAVGALAARKFGLL